MIGVDEALALVLQRARPQPPVRVPLAEALDRVLAEDVASDVDSPPHDKALVDGYAVIAADLAGAGPVELVILEEVTAGAVPTRTVTTGAASRIMTGAPLPAGADAVVMVERTELLAQPSGPARVRIDERRVAAGHNIMPRAASLRRDEVVLTAGAALRPIEIGLLAEVGRDEVAVRARPRVAVLATGNELVPAGQTPAAGQIRNSNGPMLAALVARAGGSCVDLGIGRDRREELTQRVQQGLEADVLVLSGGVSAGVLDLVPGVLAEEGVEQVFHKVHLKPGKPLWFGVQPAAAADKLVFGLPGNPVSSLVCFELFVRPALAALAGDDPQGLPRRQAALADDYRQRGDRPTYYPARYRQTDGVARVQTLDWKGSADLRTLSDANCLAYFPAGSGGFAAGETVDVFLL